MGQFSQYWFHFPKLNENLLFEVAYQYSQVLGSRKLGQLLIMFQYPAVLDLKFA